MHPITNRHQQAPRPSPSWRLRLARIAAILIALTLTCAEISKAHVYGEGFGVGFVGEVTAWIVCPAIALLGCIGFEAAAYFWDASYRGTAIFFTFGAVVAVAAMIYADVFADYGSRVVVAQEQEIATVAAAATSDNAKIARAEAAKRIAEIDEELSPKLPLSWQQSTDALQSTWTKTKRDQRAVDTDDCDGKKIETRAQRAFCDGPYDNDKRALDESIRRDRLKLERAKLVPLAGVFVPPKLSTEQKRSPDAAFFKKVFGISVESLSLLQCTVVAVIQSIMTALSWRCVRALSRRLAQETAPTQGVVSRYIGASKTGLSRTATRQTLQKTKGSVRSPCSLHGKNLGVPYIGANAVTPALPTLAPEHAVHEFACSLIAHPTARTKAASLHAAYKRQCHRRAWPELSSRVFGGLINAEVERLGGWRKRFGYGRVYIGVALEH